MCLQIVFAYGSGGLRLTSEWTMAKKTDGDGMLRYFSCSRLRTLSLYLCSFAEAWIVLRLDTIKRQISQIVALFTLRLLYLTNCLSQESTDTATGVPHRRPTQGAMGDATACASVPRQCFFFFFSQIRAYSVPTWADSL